MALNTASPTHAEAPTIQLRDVHFSRPSVGSSSLLNPTSVLAALKGVFNPNPRLQRKPVINGITLDLHTGERVGVIGGNGAGKSTLLQILSGVFPPTSGSVDIRGNAVGIMTAQSGIRVDATGIENIMFNCLRLGLSREEMKSVLPKIVEDSGLGTAINWPVSEYSSGMRLRLSFSIVTSVSPETMIFDEWIGFGDHVFRNHASKRLDVMLENANVVVLASHNLNLVARLCNRVLVIDNGRIIFDAPSAEAILFYRSELEKDSGIGISVVSDTA